MLTLRFKKEGAKKKYIFRLIATDSQRAANSGKVLEVLGWWNPRTDEAHLNKERILYHFKNGAQCSEAVLNLLIKKGIKKAKKVPVHKKAKKISSEPGPQAEVNNQPTIENIDSKESPSVQSPEATIAQNQEAN